MIITLSHKIKTLLLLAGLSFTLCSAPIQAATPQKAPAATVMEATETRPVNINKADAETLAAAMVGVGVSKAEAIVKYREAHGPFTSVEQLVEVKGIGQSILTSNRKRLTLE